MENLTSELKQFLAHHTGELTPKQAASLRVQCMEAVNRFFEELPVQPEPVSHLSAHEVTIEFLDETSGLLYRRQLPIDIEENGNGIKTTDGEGVWLDTPLIDILHGEGTIEKRIPAMEDIESVSINYAGDYREISNVEVRIRNNGTDVYYYYNGKNKTPKVTVKDTSNNLLKEGTDFNVTYKCIEYLYI